MKNSLKRPSNFGRVPAKKSSGRLTKTKSKVLPRCKDIPNKLQNDLPGFKLKPGAIKKRVKL